MKNLSRHRRMLMLTLMALVSLPLWAVDEELTDEELCLQAAMKYESVTYFPQEDMSDGLVWYMIVRAHTQWTESDLSVLAERLQLSAADTRQLLEEFKAFELGTWPEFIDTAPKTELQQLVYWEGIYGGYLNSLKDAKGEEMARRFDEWISACRAATSLGIKESGGVNFSLEIGGRCY